MSIVKRRATIKPIKGFSNRTRADWNAGIPPRGDAAWLIMFIPVIITVYADKSFTFVTKTPPAAVLIKKACGINSGSGSPKANKVATIKKAQVEEIAKLKMKDLNAANIETAMKMIAGTARSMGVKVEE